MRKIDITPECSNFIESQDRRVIEKFYQLVQILIEVKVVHSNFVKKIQKTHFFELRIKAGNEYRVLLFAIDHLNFAECESAILLNGFQKKSTKDYKKAIKEADKLLKEYLKDN